MQKLLVLMRAYKYTGDWIESDEHSDALSDMTSDLWPEESLAYREASDAAELWEADPYDHESYIAAEDAFMLRYYAVWTALTIRAVLSALWSYITY